MLQKTAPQKTENRQTEANRRAHCRRLHRLLAAIYLQCNGNSFDAVCCCCCLDCQQERERERERERMCIGTLSRTRSAAASGHGTCHSQCCHYPKHSVSTERTVKFSSSVKMLCGEAHFQGRALTAWRSGTSNA